MDVFIFIAAPLIYGLLSYCNYRIVNKFTAEVTLWENFIPIWNTYLLAKEVMTKPRLFMLAQFAPILIALVVLLSDPAQLTLEKIQDKQGFYDNLKLIYSVALAYFWGRVASRLGKRCWLHWIFALLQFPLLISIPMMAFDRSYPASKA